MNAIKATVQNGRVLVKFPADWPEGSEVVIIWSSPAGAIPPLSSEKLRSLADRFPPPAEWYAEADDFFDQNPRTFNLSGHQLFTKSSAPATAESPRPPK